ncbi:MAG: type III-A CRISPR-associated protein Csm2 [Methanobacteriota archaeon]|nr:MAG: type III-A CRISPR-associated protein Csm2 [Euryarchaeota archaeon]
MTFRFPNLSKIRNRNNREKKEKEWKRRFQNWGLQPSAPINFDDQTLKNIILPGAVSDDESAKLLVRWADIIGAFLSEDLSTSQIRAIFGEVRQIQGQLRVSQVSNDGTSNSEKPWTRLRLLIPKMRYRKAKEKGVGVENLVKILEPAVKLVLDDDPSQRAERFERFVNFFEAILAYHKSYGGN